MEQTTIKAWIEINRINLDDTAINILQRYADLILESSQKFNLTGAKTKEEIQKTLILESLEPIYKLDVPHGTNFVDIGSGAGIPGIVIGVYFKNTSGVLIESNQKKANFIQDAIDFLRLSNIRVVCDRAENISRDQEHREVYDWCFIRALGNLYTSLEVGVPFIKLNGVLYIYSNTIVENIASNALKHADNLGVSYLTYNKRPLDMPKQGMLFQKNKITPPFYPRRFAVIKRDAKMINH